MQRSIPETTHRGRVGAGSMPLKERFELTSREVVYEDLRI